MGPKSRSKVAKVITWALCLFKAYSGMEMNELQEN